MQSAGHVRTNLLTVLKVVTVVFIVVFCVPLVSTILSVYDTWVSGSFFGAPMVSFAYVFLVFLDIAFLAIIAGAAFMIIRRYGVSPDEELR